MKRLTHVTCYLFINNLLSAGNCIRHIPDSKINAGLRLDAGNTPEITDHG